MANRIVKHYSCLNSFIYALFISLIIFLLRSQSVAGNIDNQLQHCLKNCDEQSTPLKRIKYEAKESNNMIEDLSQKVTNKNSYGNFFKDMTRTKFLPLDPIHSPFNPPTTIEEISSLPLAFGDFDADRYTDIFMLAPNGTSISLLKGHSCVDGKTPLTYFGSRRCLSHMSDFNCTFQTLIYNLAASDFTGETFQDLLITVKSSEQDPHSVLTNYDIVLVRGNYTASNFNCHERKILVKNALSEPFILDYNGDMISDFIVETKDCFLQLILGGPFNSDDMDGRYLCLENITTIKHMSRPHASGFLNLNHYYEDMTSDIFVNGKDSFEYIYNTPGVGFSNTKKLNFPSVPIRGQSAFVDINFDGELEHLIPVCHDSKSFRNCRKPGLMVLHTSSGIWTDVLSKVSIVDRPWTFYENIDKKIYDYIQLPVTLHIGDLNYDGYPDFATVLQDINTMKTFGAIFLNVKDEFLESTHNGRLFQLDSLVELKHDVLMVSLFDIYNNGRLNLLLTTQNPKTKQLSLEAYDYYLEKKGYFSFLRVNIISGLCSDKSDKHPCPNDLAFGSTPPGVTVCFDGPSGNEKTCSVQMSQSSYFSLQPPYIIFGLGEVLNVINDLTISIANGNQTERIRKWNEIIPGSKLVLVPYQPDNVDNWELRVFINMSIYSLVALLFLVVLCLILLVAILWLHFREKVEDRIDNQQYRNAWFG